MTCHVGEGIVICDGRSGGWRVATVWCPWCCVEGEAVRGLSVLIYGGYGGFDAVCGSCGFAWSCDDEWLPRMDPQDNEKREANIALVASVPDPKCWRCHDTGDVGIPGHDEPDAHPCACQGGEEPEVPTPARYQGSAQDPPEILPGDLQPLSAGAGDGETMSEKLPLGHKFKGRARLHDYCFAWVVDGNCGRPRAAHEPAPPAAAPSEPKDRLGEFAAQLAGLLSTTPALSTHSTPDWGAQALPLIRSELERVDAAARAEGEKVGAEREREIWVQTAERWAHELQFNPAGLPMTAKYLRDFAAAIRARGQGGEEKR